MRSRTKLHARLHNNMFCDQSVIIAFFFDISLDKQVIVKKNHLQLGKKSLNPMEEQEKNQYFY